MRGHQHGASSYKLRCELYIFVICRQGLAGTLLNDILFLCFFCFSVLFWGWGRGPFSQRRQTTIKSQTTYPILRYVPFQHRTTHEPVMGPCGFSLVQGANGRETQLSHKLASSPCASSIPTAPTHMTIDWYSTSSYNGQTHNAHAHVGGNSPPGE